MKRHRSGSATDAVATACSLSTLLLGASFGMCLFQGWWGSCGIRLDASRSSAVLGLLLCAVSLFALTVFVWRRVSGRRHSRMPFPDADGALSLSLTFLFLLPAALLLRACLR
jgi:hypothetical protein